MKQGRIVMSSGNRIMVVAGFLAGCLMLGSQASAQSSQSQSGQQPATTSKDQKPADSGSTLAIPTTQPPVSAEEDAAAKAFQAMPNSDLPKKIAAGEDFLAKYPESRYRSPVYSTLTIAYIQAG